MAEIIQFDACNTCFFALRKSGEVISWGSIPDALRIPTDIGIVKKILCMPNTVFAIDSTGLVRGWGLNDNGLLDMPAGLKAKNLFSNNGKSVCSILPDDTVLIWGSSDLHTSIPDGLRAKKVALYEKYAFAINMDDNLVSWGTDIPVPPTLGGKVLSVASVNNTAVVIKENGYPFTWKSAAFRGVPVIPPALNMTSVSAIDGYGICYGLISKKKLYCWKFSSENDTIQEIGKPINKVVSFTVKVNGAGLPMYCIVHNTGLVSVIGGGLTNRRLPPSVAQYGSQSTDGVLLVLPDLGPPPLGENDDDDSETSLNVVNPVLTDIPVFVKSVSLGDSHAAALTEDGKVICWGSFCPPEIQQLSNVKEVACGKNSIHVLNSDYQISIWDKDGQKTLSEATYLINNDDSDNSIYVSFDNKIMGYEGGQYTLVSSAQKILCAQKTLAYTIYVTDSYKVKVVAEDENNELTPFVPSDLENKKIFQASGGLNTAIAIDTSRNLYGWGNSYFSKPVLPEGLTKAKFVTSSSKYHAVIKSDDTMVVWSYSADWNPIKFSRGPANLKVKYISLTDAHICVVTTYGKVFAVSLSEDIYNVPSSIAASSLIDSTTFLPLLPSLATVRQLATGKGFTLAIRKDTSIIGWGGNDGGVLDIPAISAKFICAGDQVAGAIKQDDSFVSWGTNASTELAGLKIKKVILHKSGLALTLSGEVIAFGLADLASRYPVPTGLVAEDIDFLEFGDKKRYAALKADKTVLVWGDDVVPVLEKAKRFAVGRNAVLIITNENKVVGFGSNDHGELDIISQLKAKEIFAGDATYAIAQNNSFGNWGKKLEDTEAYINSENWIKRGSAFSRTQSRIAYMVYNGNHYATVNIEGQLVLWGANDNLECIKPRSLLLSNKPVNMGGVITSMALNSVYGAAVVDGSVKVWGGLNNSAEARLANLVPGDNVNMKQIVAAGDCWFALNQEGDVIHWNDEYALATGTTPALFNIVNGGVKYDKISASNDIIMGLVKNTNKVICYGKKGFSVNKIPASIKNGNVRDIFAGPTCAMAIDYADNLVIWGAKYNPCLNPPADLGPIKRVVCSEFYGLAIKMDGSLKIWGGLVESVLEAITKLVPVGQFKEIAISGTRVVCVRDDDRVIEWLEDNSDEAFVMPDKLQGSIISTSGSQGFSAAVNLQGELVGWGGSLAVGQNDPLGSLITPDVAAVPVVPVAAPKKNASVQVSVVSEGAATIVASGYQNVGIVDETGRVIIWGARENNLHFIPRHLNGVDYLAMGPTCCVARNSSGQYIYWGESDSKLSILPDSLDAKKIVLTDYVGFAINEDDTLLKWGQIPGMRPEYDTSNLPEGLTKARDVDGYGLNYIAADLEGQIYLWGSDDVGKYDSTKRAIAVSAGKKHYAAILEDNTVISWGTDEYKQLNVPAGLKAKQIKCGQHFTVAIDMDDNVVAWGFPKACADVPAGLKAVSVACGSKHIIALQEGGKYVIWAHNIYNAARQAPTEVFVDPGLSLAETSMIQFRLEFPVKTKYELNTKQLKQIALKETVFDLNMHNPKRKLVDFLLEHQGNAVIFRYKGEQTATLKSEIWKGLRDDDTRDSHRINVFYECKKMVPFSPDTGEYGTFEFDDIYRKPYYQLNLGNGTFLITMNDLERLFKQNQFWILQDTGIELKYTASYWSVVAGGPLISSNHCQDNTDKKVFMLVPFSILTDEEDELEELVNQNIVKVKLGEDVTDIDISDSKKVSAVKQKFAALKGLPVDGFRFIAAGKILSDDADVVPGIMLMVALSKSGGLRLARLRKTCRVKRRA